MLSSKKYILKYVILKILNKEYGDATIIPSENRLAIKFNCARLTARSALTMLVHFGILESKQGMGYCVSHNALNILLYALKLQWKATRIESEKLKKFNFNFTNDINIENCTDAFLIKNFDDKKLLSMTFLFINRNGISKINNEAYKFEDDPLNDLVSLGIIPHAINTEFLYLSLEAKNKEFKQLNYENVDVIPAILQEWINGQDEWIAKTVVITKKALSLFHTTIKL